LILVRKVIEILKAFEGRHLDIAIFLLKPAPNCYRGLSLHTCCAPRCTCPPATTLRPASSLCLLHELVAGRGRSAFPPNTRKQRQSLPMAYVAQPRAWPMPSARYGKQQNNESSSLAILAFWVMGLLRDCGRSKGSGLIEAEKVNETVGRHRQLSGH
jgi:hypothetical protein